MIDDGNCEAIGGMKISRGNRSTGRKPVPVPLCPPQIPHDLTRARIRAAAVGLQRLINWIELTQYAVELRFWERCVEMLNFPISYNTEFFDLVKNFNLPKIPYIIITTHMGLNQVSGSVIRIK
jgi:hypothetical protein